MPFSACVHKRNFDTLPVARGGERTRRWSCNTNGCAAFCADTTPTSVCRATGTGWALSIKRHAESGIGRSIAAASGRSRGSAMCSCSTVSPCPFHESPVPDRWPLADSGKPQEEPSAGKPHARICEGEAKWLSYSTLV